MHAAMEELALIFPQHNKETITQIYNTVVVNSGENSHDANVLPICIEKLLELPSNKKDNEYNDNKNKNGHISRSSKRSSSDKLSISATNSDKDKFLLTSKEISRDYSPLPLLRGCKRKRNTTITTNGNNFNIKVGQDGTIRNSPEKQDLSTLTKGMVGYLEICMEKIKAIINNVDNVYLEKLINEQTELLPVLEVVNNVVEHLLEDQNYPKVDDRPNNVDIHPHGTASTSAHSTTNPTSSNHDLKYKKQSVILLQNSFPKVSTNTIKKIFDRTHNYTISFVELEDTLEQITSGKVKVEDTIIKSFLISKKYIINIKHLTDKLTAEMQEIEKRKKELSVIDDNSKCEEGNSINCGCCYNEVAFEEMIQCLDGHLFCTTCLQSYSKESIYGSGKVQLFCMTHGCDSTFPMSQLKKALLEGMMEKYMERVQNEDIKLANLHNLINCPHCDFAAEMDDGDKVFRCQNKACMKESCRYCKEDWESHFGLPCKEVEKNEATNLRVTYEEKMTQAKVRKCWQCSTLFLKSDGCNKMTCRCGAKMCYICREEKIDYQHFCQHARNPDSGCTTCKQCSLWTDPSQDDDRAIAEIKKQAEDERMKLDGIEKVSIGPDPNTISKKDPGKPTSSHHAGEYYGSSEDDSYDDSTDSDSFRHRSPRYDFHHSDSEEDSDLENDLDVWELNRFF